MHRGPSLREVVVFCATAAAFAISYVMLRDALGGESPLLGLMLMFYFLGLARIGEPILMLRMPGFLREVRAWEAKGAIYQCLGVQRFGEMLRASPARFLNTSVYVSSGRRDLQSVYRYAASAEAAHFWAAALFMPYIVLTWCRGQGGVAALFVLVQVLFNIYPILHLRLLRGRLDLLFARLAARDAGRRDVRQ